MHSSLNLWDFLAWFKHVHLYDSMRFLDVQQLRSV